MKNTLTIISFLTFMTIISCQGQKNDKKSIKKVKTEKHMDSRSVMTNDIAHGYDNTETIDNSTKSILTRGCDPEMGKRAIKLLKPLLGNPEMIAATDDNNFIELIKSRKWSVVFFAPGACRYDAAKIAIPGGNNFTEGWSLEDYRAFVKKHQGKDIQIVETPDETKTFTLLKEALNISK